MIISVSGYTGEAALVDYDDEYAILAHRGPANIFTPGRTYIINDRSWTVLSNSPSPYVFNVTNVKGKYN